MSDLKNINNKFEEKKVAIILVNYKDYAKKYLVDCLISLRKQDYLGERKIFIVDNASSEDSFKYLIKSAPEAEIIKNKNNDGFAKGNNSAIKLALAQGFDYIILFNLDIAIEPDCVKIMVEAAENSEVGAVQARLMLYKEKNVINSFGNVTHFLGFGYSNGYKEKYNSSNFYCKEKEICYPSGAAVLFKREILEKIGLFDEEFWMYNEDQDIGWRVWLAGYKCVLASEAIVYHKYEFCRSIKQYYYLDRNRILVILKNYYWRTLFLIAPAFLLMEIGQLLFAWKNGLLKEKLAVYNYFLKKKNWNYILCARKKSQNLRQVKDKDIIKLFSGKIWYQEVGDWKLKIANIIFNAYWKIIKNLIIW
ncbi:MAG: glycosyltransferase family 2 protein [Patescibacteria group bacterium]|nr:glycosyltransferase family 2 protein [Patescibacteria group bacterium]MBU1870844.1 glycosyltransferase family 2 protein [Patescibacteria group bacterium]